MATRVRRRRASRRVFVRPFLGADCRQDFERLQTRLLGTFTPLGAVDTSVFEQVMTTLWKRNFTADPRPRTGCKAPDVLRAGPLYAELLPEYWPVADAPPSPRLFRTRNASSASGSESER